MTNFNYYYMRYEQRKPISRFFSHVSQIKTTLEFYELFFSEEMFVSPTIMQHEESYRVLGFLRTLSLVPYKRVIPVTATTRSDKGSTDTRVVLTH